METNLGEFILKLRHTLRTTPTLPPPDWHQLIEEGLQGAYAQDVDDLAELAHIIASELDSRGPVDEALAELDHIARFVAEDPESLAMVTAMRSGFLVAKGRNAEARELAARMRELTPAIQSARARATVLSSYHVVRLTCLERGAGDEAASWLADRDEDEAARLFVASWHIPYLFAMGHRLQARPWVRSMKVQARSPRQPHPWREADAVSFECADRIIDDLAFDPGEAVAPRNHLAWSRLARVSLYAASRREAWESIEAFRAPIESGAARLGADAVGAPAHYFAVVEALRDGELESPPAPPASVHLGNLGAVLAGAEAIAYAGSQADAGRWLTWWDAALPEDVRSSLEWPASAERIHALLAVRAGEPRRARRLFERATRSAAAARQGVEQALAQLQLAELLAWPEFVVPEHRRLSMRRMAWTALRDAGIRPAAHAYAVGRGLSEGAGDGPGVRLTPRETEVLTLLAQGLTYRAIGDRLGIAWPTVQTLAHRIYEKLGVSGKMAAVSLARELGVL